MDKNKILYKIIHKENKLKYYHKIINKLLELQLNNYNANSHQIVKIIKGLSISNKLKIKSMIFVLLLIKITKNTTNRCLLMYHR
jgi:hypothetical protein